MRTVPEWIGATPDTPLPDRVKLRIWGRDNGRCKICTRKCGVGGEPSAFDHIVALVNGGQNRESNYQLLCVPCHAVKTRGDVAEKSHVYRRRKSNAGIRKPSRFACSRNSKFKKKISGEVVLR